MQQAMPRAGRWRAEVGGFGRVTRCLVGKGGSRRVAPLPVWHSVCAARRLQSNNRCVLLDETLADIPWSHDTEHASHAYRPVPPFIPIRTRRGLDVVEVTSLDELAEEGAGVRILVQAVVSPGQLSKLRGLGVTAATTGLSVSRAPARARASASAEASAFGWNVFRSFDEAGGIGERIEAVAENYPQIAKLEKFGESVQGRPLYAVRLGNKKSRSRLRKPEVLIVATHHAREWMAAEMGIRLLEYLSSEYDSNDRVRDLLDRVNVWLVPMANPDGYEYTFTDERLWRKNLTDNDGDGEITLNDGVDLNRNFGSRWGRDDEGSSGNFTSATYRGTAPFSTPENAAMRDFMRAHRFKFLISYHTFSNLILYPNGWQVQTPSVDNEIFVAQAGTDDNPAIVDSANGVGYDPGVGADLYITNGDFTVWTYEALRIPSYTVEISPGADEANGNYGFEFPDDEGLVQAAFDDNLEFALALAESALTPTDPVSPVNLPAAVVAHEPLQTSFGKTQTVAIDALRPRGRSYYTDNYWGRPELSYSIDGGKETWSRFRVKRGKYYNDKRGVHYDRYVASIKGQQAGSSVRYSVHHRGEVLGPYTYVVEQATNSPVLIMAAEDYPGRFPDYSETEESTASLNYIDYYTSALDAAGIGYDIWDVDARGAAPDAEAVLSHYKAVVWYSGRDFAPDTLPSFAILDDEYLNMRRYINYFGGKVPATGQDLGWIATIFQFVDSNGVPRSDDFFQYYLGALRSIDTGGLDGDGEPYPVRGSADDPVLGGLEFALSGGTGASNQTSPTEFLHTSQSLDGFPDVVAAKYLRAGGAGPFEPFSGDYYVYSDQLDRSYKRLGGTFTVPADDTRLKLRASYDIESNWDYAFVEVRVVGTDAWTTLPEVGGATTRDTGESCPAGWIEQLHPELAAFQTLNADGACSPTGTTGEWHAMTGNSNGWQSLEFDLSAYAGQEIELHLAYVSDWGTQNFGVFVDDVEVPGTGLQDFEDGLGGLQITSTFDANLPNNWERRTGQGLETSAAVRTPYSVLFGFGFEAIDTDKNRADVMRRTMDYLGVK